MRDIEALAREVMRAERGRPEPGHHVRDLVRARVAATVASLPVPALGPTAGSRLGAFVRSRLGVGTLGLLLGSGLGAVGHAVLGHPRERVVTLVERAEASAPVAAHADAVSAPASSPVEVSFESLPLAPPAEPSAVRTGAPPPAPLEKPSATTDADLAHERALLAMAHTALARGDAPAAVDALDQHAARFARGRLAEEREVLAVQALTLAGRSVEARGRAARFKRRFPESILMPAVDAALATIP